MDSNSMRIPIHILGKETVGRVPALIDSGAQGKFINRRTVRQLGLKELLLKKPIQVFNVDGTPNELGNIRNTVEVPINIAGTVTKERLLVTQLGKQHIILGMDWLKDRNPSINWITGELNFKKQEVRTVTITEEEEDVTTIKTLPLDDTAILRSEKEFQVVLEEGATLPTRGSEEAAGLDLYAAEDLIIPANGRTLVNTKIKAQVPPGTYGRIAPRSGLALKGIDIGAGVIDRDYTGYLKVLLINTTNNNFEVGKGDRIAQLILEQIS